MRRLSAPAARQIPTRFELVDSTDLFFKPDDELRYEVGRKTVRGNTDRFALLFRKPEE